MSNTMKSQNRRLLANRILSVVLSIAMVWSSTPLPATAGTETALSDQAGASQVADASSEEASVSLDADANATVQESAPKDQKQGSAAPKASSTTTAAPKSADVSLNLGHAYLTYKDQKISLPAKRISLPTDKDFSFTATPDTGYEIVEVYTSYNSKPANDANKQVLKPDAKGVYKVSASAVAEGITLTIATQEAPSKEDQKADVTAIDASQEESASDQVSDEAEDTKDAEGQADSQEAEDDEEAQAENAADQDGEAADAQESADDQESIEEAAQDQEADDQADQKETPATKTTYTYEDDQVSVTAVLQDPEAVPDDAQFRVTPVNQEASGYNYEAYMDALNGGLSEDQAYTAENTLLYDVAFMVPKEDSDGKVIQGEWEEYEPTAGSVTITFNFKKSQLTQDLDAQANDEVEVKHLPLSNAARAQVDSTAEATGISASDVRVEDLSASVSTKGAQTVSLTTSDLSVMAVAKRKSASSFAIKDATDAQLSLADIMGNARYYGIVADEWYLAEAETNAAVKTIYANGSQSGNDMTSGDDAQPWVIGDIKGYTTNVISYWPYKAETVINNNPNPFQFKGRQVNAYVTQHVYDVLHDYNNNKNASYKIISQSTANTYVGNLESALRSTSSALATKSSVQGTLPAVGSDSNHQLTNYVLDFSDKPAGTYYVNLDSVIDQLSQQASGLKIRKKSNQTIVLNVTKSGTVNLQKFEVSTDGGGYVGSDQTTAAGEAIAKSIVWNVPNATTLNTSGSILGMILAPNATFNLTSTSAGWLYAKTVMSGSGEWHQIWQSFDQNYPKPDNPTPTTKTISVKVDKVWVGPAGKSVTVHLYANDQDTGKTLTLDAGKGWSDSFSNLPEKDAKGKKISYTVAEDPVTGYVSSISGSAKAGYTITNTATETTRIAGAKTWDDQDNADGIRPSEVWVNLRADGQWVTSYKMTEADGWQYHFDGLPKYSTTDGHQIAYTVDETVPSNYEANFDGYNVTNRHTPQKTSVSVTKRWVGPAGKSVTVHLYANDQDTGKTLTLTAENGWSGTFADLNQKAGGQDIAYTVAEDPVTGYVSSISGSAKAGYTITNTATETTRIAGAKTWDDQDNADGIRPSEVWVNLRADGQWVTSYKMTEADGWQYHFDGLPKYSTTDGHQIAYTVDETVPSGYEANFDGYNVTNTHRPATTSLTVRKEWMGPVPAGGRVLVRLFANGRSTNRMATLTAAGPDRILGTADDWTASFQGLPANEGGSAIKYTVAEDAVANYDAVVTGSAAAGFTVTNTNVETTFVQVSKAWEDADNQDGLRPDSIRVQLYADGQEAQGQVLTLSEANKWSATFSDLAKYAADGHQVAYTVAELDVPEGYKSSVKGDAASGFTVTNTHEVQKTSVPVAKYWVGPVPPTVSSVTVRLLADGADTGRTLELSKANGWSGSFEGLPANEGGSAIKYTVAEDAVANYDAVVTGSAKAGYIVTNTNVEKTSVRVSKAWEDADDQDGLRPDSIRVQLYADGQACGDPADLSEANGWSATFSDLAKYAADGHQVAYTVAELDVPEGYKSSVKGDAASGFTVTNTHEVQKTSVPVSKSWVGPAAGPVTVRLLADGQDTGRTLSLSADNGWSGSFEALDANAAGQAITYTVRELDVPGGYESSVSGDAASGFVVTNTNTETTSVSGTKTWVDDGDRDGVRPSSVTVRLWADGAEVDSREVSASDNWAFSFDGLARYAADGHEVFYSVTEDAVPGYETSYDGYHVTNSYAPGKTSVSVTKNWDDADDQDGVRPGSIRVQLYADGQAYGEPVTLSDEAGWTHTWSDLYQKSQGSDIDYTVQELDVPEGYTVAAAGDATKGFTLTNSHQAETTQVSATKAWDDDNDRDGLRPESIRVQLYADGQAYGDPVELSESNGWATTWSGLAKNSKGKAIAYTVRELDVPKGYRPTVTGDATTGFTVTNTHEVQKTSVPVAKYWVGPVPPTVSSVTVRLLADGADTGKTLSLSADNGWSGSFEDLDAKAAGHDIAYTVAEDPSSDGSYAGVVAGSASTGFFITNTNVEKTSVRVSKAWEDADDQDGLRPDSIRVQLYADGQACGDPADLSEANGWSATFSDLAKYAADGHQVAYTVAELDVPEGYKSSVKGDAASGFTVTNTHETAKTSVPVSKSWVGPAAGPVTVRLLADGADTGRTLELSEANGWSGSFEGLDAKAAGRAITYTVSEDKVANYETAITGSAAAGFAITNTNVETTSVSGNKIWADDNDRDRIRPQSITVRLLADGQEVQTQTVTGPAWSYSFTGLPKYDRTTGKAIAYTVTEDEVPGYASIPDGTNLVNTHQAKKTSLKVTKAWDDSNDQDGIRPGEVTVQLYANDAAVAGKTLTLSADNQWSGSFEGLPANAAGQPIAYTVKETNVPEGYDVAIAGDATKGFTLTNSHQAETTQISVTKLWDDADDQDGVRPSTEDLAAHLRLTSDAAGLDLSAYQPTVTDKGDGTYTVTYEGMPKYQDGGTKVTYTVTEVEGAFAAQGYKAQVASAQDGQTLVNSHDTATTSVSITKVWSDSNNQDGVRPSAEDFVRSVSLTSSMEGQDLSSYQPTVTDKGDGTYTVTYEGLPKFQRGGTQVTYAIVETAVPGYAAVDGTASATDGGSITNAHQIQTIDIPVTKSWDDQGDQDGRRPTSIQVQLYADGQPVEGQVLTLTAAGDDGQEGTEDDWKGSFTTLSRYRDQGTEIHYTVQEVARVEGYESSVTGSAADGFTITNSHQVEKTKLDVSKDWEGPTRETATVRLYANGQDTGKTLTLSADSDWKASFEDLDVYQEGQPIIYTVQEDSVPTAYTAQVTGDAGTGFTVTNTYAASGTAQVQAQKDLLGGTLAAGQFSFSLYPADADGQVTGDAIQSAVPNAADGSVAFSPLDYTELDLKDADGAYNQTATFHYVIREDIPEDALLVDEGTYLKDGVLYDAHDELVEVTLTDDGAGVINAAVTYPKSLGDVAYLPTFTNSLAARAQLSLVKEAYTTEATPSYTFQMVSSDDQGNPTGTVARGYAEGQAFVDDGTQPISDTATGLGALSFHEVTYTKEGTYHYLLTELGASDAGSDTVQYLATVQVQKDQTGALVASAPSYLYRQDEDASWETLSGDQTPTFYNNYQVSMAYRSLALAANRRRVERVSVTPTARKLLDGKADMKAGQFSFGLYEVDAEGTVAGEPVQVAQNASDGTVAFAPLTFSEVGTHTYVIRELPGADASITYDEAQYTYTVVVAQGQDQALHAEATYGTDDGQAPTFANTTKTVKVRIQKRTQDINGNLGEGLYNAQYGMWMVGQNGAADVYLGNQRSDEDGYMVFDVPITQGRYYYFKEEVAPEGHLVDPYPSAQFQIVKDEATGRYRMELAS